MIPAQPPTEEPQRVEPQAELAATGINWDTQEKALPLAVRLSAIADRLGKVPERLRSQLMMRRNGHGPTVLEICAITSDSTADLQRIEQHAHVWEVRLSEAEASLNPTEVQAAALRMLASRKHGMPVIRRDMRVVGYVSPAASEACRHLASLDAIAWQHIEQLARPEAAKVEPQQPTGPLDLGILRQSFPHLLRTGSVANRVMASLLVSADAVSVLHLAGGKGASGGTRDNVRKALLSLESVGLAERAGDGWTRGRATNRQ